MERRKKERSNLVKFVQIWKVEAANWRKSVKQQKKNRSNLKFEIQIKREGVWIWSIIWNDKDGCLAMLDNLQFEILINKSTFGQYEKGNIRWVLCNGTKSENIVECPGHILSAQKLKGMLFGSRLRN